jgi:NAD(P)-dependent dehydrogenase (short-subunit alcohol dehydrogenase family)
MAGFPSPTKTWHNSPYPSIDPTRPELSLAGKSVIITGGGSGIGLAISKAVALAGVSRLAIIGRRTEVLAKAKATIKYLVGDKTEVFTFSADVGDKEQVDRAFADISSAFGGRTLDVLINNAGYFTGVRPFGTETIDEWNTAFNINIKGVYLVATAFIAKAKKDATIVHISTGLVHLPASFRTGFSSYCSTKLAGDKIMEFVQAENPSLHVVEVHPGQVTETEMAGKLKGRSHIDDGMFLPRLRELSKLTMPQLILLATLLSGLLVQRLNS